MYIWPTDLRWSADRQVSVLSFPNQSGSNSPTPEGSKACLALAGILNQEYAIESTRQPEHPPTTLHAFIKRPLYYIE